MNALKNNSCPFCKLPLRDYHDYVTCSKCRTSYHKKCWTENGGCTLCNIDAAPASETSARTLSWYLYHGNRNLGPLTWEELCSRPGIQPDDLVWNSSMPRWIRAAEIPNLLLEGSLPDEAVERENEAGENDIKAVVLPTREEQPAVVPPSPESRTEQEPDEAWAPLSPEETLEADGTVEAIEEEAFAAVEESAAATPLETDTAPKEKPGGAGRGRSSSPAEQPDEEGGNLSRDPARTERIIDQIFEDQPAAATQPEPGYIDGKVDHYDDCDYDYDREPGPALKFAGPMITGILLALGGAAAAAAFYLNAAGWGQHYHIAATAVGGAIALSGIIIFSLGLIGRLKNISRHSPRAASPKHRI